MWRWKVCSALVTVSMVLALSESGPSGGEYDRPRLPPHPCLMQGGRMMRLPPRFNLRWILINLQSCGSGDLPYYQQFIVGDIYYVYDYASLILTTTFNGPQAPLSPVGVYYGEAGWESGDYSHGDSAVGGGAGTV